MKLPNNWLYLLGGLLVLPAFLLTWRTNNWSRQYLLTRMGQSEDTPTLTTARNHPRAAVWLAQDALAQEQTDQAITLLADTDIPQNKLAALVLGEVYFTQQNSTQAAQIWAEAEASNWLLQAGEIAIANKQWEAAIIYLETAFQLQPETTVLFLVTLYEQQEEWEKARQVLQQAIDQFPHSSFQNNWLRALGDVLVADGQIDAGIQTYQQILKNTPQDIDTLLSLGRALSVNQASEEAKAIFEQVIDLNPQNGASYMALAELLIEQGQYDVAAPLFANAVQYEPNEFTWWLQWATAAQKSGCLPCAITIYENMTHQFPKNGVPFFHLSELYKQQNQPQKAIAAIKEALHLLKPVRAQHYVRAGNIYQWVNDTDKAQQAYMQALQDDPTNQEALTALEQLNP